MVFVRVFGTAHFYEEGLRPRCITSNWVDDRMDALDNASVSVPLEQWSAMNSCGVKPCSKAWACDGGSPFSRIGYGGHWGVAAQGPYHLDWCAHRGQRADSGQHPARAGARATAARRREAGSRRAGAGLRLRG